jgi:hypothetical protein
MAGPALVAQAMCPLAGQASSGGILSRTRCSALALLRRAGTVANASAWYGPGSAAHRSAKGYALRCVRDTRRYAMNIRAAEASVSRPPKAMKIFPISEV